MTMQTAVSVAALLMFSGAAYAQESRELVRSLDDARSQRLEEYNSTFLRGETYFASRHRIVELNAALLSQAREITFTPFEDVEPIALVPVRGTPRRTGEEHIFWTGIYKPFALLETLGGPQVSVTIAANAWDLDPSGAAVISSQNRFEFSPLWTFDERGNPVLDRSKFPPGALVVPGDPPRTPAQIERHMRLQTLDKHAFHSVEAVFDVPGSSRYVLKPLKYSPRYSVLYELTRDTVVPVRIDAMPEGSPLTEEELAVFERYNQFLETLPKDEPGKSIRGDVP